LAEKRNSKSLYQFEASIEEIKTEKRSRGNPGKNPKPPVIISTWKINVQILDENKKAVEKLSQKEESFVIITTVFDKERRK
jgi:tRNA (Thr-GGU) A37 N-methylase